MQADTAVSGVLNRTWAEIEGTLRGYLATVYRADGSILAQASFPVDPGRRDYQAACDRAYSVAKQWLALWGLD